MNISQILENFTDGPKIALCDKQKGENRSITFDQLKERMYLCSAQLVKAGIGKGSRMVVAAPLTIETYILLLSLFRIGAVAVIPDLSAGLRQLRLSMSLTKPDGIIGSSSAVWASHMLSETKRIKWRLQMSDLVNDGALEIGTVDTSHRQDVEHDHPALITFTSGSTGCPKAIVRTHDFLLKQHQILANNLSKESDTVELTTLPVFVLSNLADGITSALPDCDMRKPGRIDAKRVIKQINETSVNRILASPAFLGRLVANMEQHDIVLPDVTRILTGGGPVFPALLQRLARVFPNAKLTIVYGSTEAEPIAHIEYGAISKEDLEKMHNGHGLLVGKPVEEIEVLISAVNCSAVDGDREILPEISSIGTNQTGEILVSGKHVIQSYLNGKGDQETKVRYGDKIWHRTGDAGYFDESGNLWLMGRCATIIDDVHGHVYPFQVEVAASELPHVRRATCLQNSGKRILVIEKVHRTPFKWIADLFSKGTEIQASLKNSFAWLHFDEIRYVWAIPVDSRHNSKILYSELARFINHA